MNPPNNFTLLRLIAALCVIVSHSWSVVYGADAAEPLTGVNYVFLGTPVRFTLGLMAVQIFFAISGFLVTKSYSTHKSLKYFIVARGARIYPGLIVAVLFATLFLGPLCTTESLYDYFSSSMTALYLIGNSSLLEISQQLPGVFATNPIPFKVNAPLWTLPYEMICYVTVLITCGGWGASVYGYLSTSRRRVVIKLFLIYLILLLAVTFPPSTSEFTTIDLRTLSFFIIPFFVGQLLFLFPECLPASRHSMLLCAAMLLTVSVLLSGYTSWLFPVVLAYTTILLALTTLPGTVASQKIPDISFGYYIYGFQVQQLLVHASMVSSPFTHAVLTILLTTPVALLSRVYVEQPISAMFRQLISKDIKRSTPQASPAVQ